MTITDVRVTTISHSLWDHLGLRENFLLMANPLMAYPEHRTVGSWFWKQAIAIVEIAADDGQVGVGWCEDGCHLIGPILDHHLKRLIIGVSPFEYEGLWDRLFRASIPYGRKGAALEAIAAVDLALWDLMGKSLNKPVYELLGGPVRPQIPVYASALHLVDREKVIREAQEYVRNGFRAMKCRFAYGPTDGAAGMRKNEEHVKAIRDAVGEEIAVMADAYMGWDFRYATQMCQRLEPYHLAWLEEPFIPDDLKSYARLRRETAIPIAGGEHEFTRWGFQQIIDMEAMDLLQPDLHRCGGLTEARKIAALAATAGLEVIPHAYSAPHVHFVAATVNAPLVEYFPLPVWEPAAADVPSPFLGQPLPQNGVITLPTTPGLGIMVNRGLLNHA
jgi:L-rhamnonate dehydratase